MRRIALACTAVLAVTATSVAQDDDESEEKDKDVQKLQAFTVSTNRDVGYISTNTLSGSRSDQAVLDIPQNIGVVNREMMEDIAQNNPIEALEYGTSGVARRSFLNTDIDIRGFRTTVELRDGLPFNTNYNQPTYDVDRIEVLKGPSALLFGRTSNPGGLINYVSVQPTKEHHGSVSVTSAIPDGKYSWNSMRINTTGPVTESKNLLYRLTLGGQAMHGVRAFTFDDDQMISGLFQWHISDVSIFNVGYSYVKKDYNYDNTFRLRPNDPVAPGQIFDLGGEFGNTAPWSHRTISTNRYWGSFNTELSPSLVMNITGSYDKSKYFSNLPGGNLIGSSAHPREIAGWGIDTMLDPYLYSSLNLQLDAVHTMSLTETIDNKLSTGVAFSTIANGQHITRAFMPAGASTTLNIDNPDYRQASSNPTVIQNNTSESNIAEYYISDQLNMFDDKLLLIAGARYNWTNGSNTNHLSGTTTTAGQQSVWVYRYGAVFKPQPWASIYYNYSESWSYLNGFDALGNELHPQYGVVDEIGFKMDKQVSDKLRATASLAFFENSQTGVLVPYTDANFTVGGKVQEGTQTTKGYEMDFSLLYAGDRGTASVVATVYDVESIDELGNPFLYTLQKQYSIWTKYTVTQGALKNFSAGVGYFDTGDRVSYHGAAWVKDFPLPVWPGYDRVDMLFAYKWKSYNFQLNIGNVMNKAHFASAPHAVSLFEGLLRNYKFTVGYRW